MKILLLVLGVSLTGCVHSAYENTDMDYRIQILEKRIKLMELDLNYLLNDCAGQD